MRSGAREAIGWRTSSLRITGAALVAASVIAGVLAASPSPLLAQSPTASSRVAPSSSVPEWQVAAGGKRAFDVASVRQDESSSFSSTQHSNIPLGPMDAFAPTAGVFSATNVPLLQYMIFAYKLRPEQFLSVQSQLPAWANNNGYDIEARAPGNPTKDEFRLMMQDLLASRFKLGIHYETQQVPVMVLVLDAPGKLGPKLRPHPEGSVCPVPPSAAEESLDACGVVTPMPSGVPGRLRVGGRNVPLAMFAALINTPSETGVDRPVLDGTMLAGKYDFVIEWTPPELSGSASPGGSFQSDPSGPTFQAFQEALEEQLGLKLEAQIGPVQVIVVEHVEEPSAN